MNQDEHLPKHQSVRFESVHKYPQMCNLETVILTNVWDSTLTGFKATTETLQMHDITLDNAECISESLRTYVASQRDQREKYENATSDIEGVLSRLYEEETPKVQKTKKYFDYLK